jgi:hypothetical protein
MTTMARIGSAGNDAPFPPAAVSVLLLKTKERSFEAEMLGMSSTQIRVIVVIVVHPREVLLLSLLR